MKGEDLSYLRILSFEAQQKYKEARASGDIAATTFHRLQYTRLGNLQAEIRDAAAKAAVTAEYAEIEEESRQRRDQTQGAFRGLDKTSIPEDEDLELVHLTYEHVVLCQPRWEERSVKSVELMAMGGYIYSESYITNIGRLRLVLQPLDIENPCVVCGGCVNIAATPFGLLKYCAVPE